MNNKKYLMGNVHNSESLKKIKLITETNELCNRCKYKKICPNGCPARLLINSGDKGISPQDCALKNTAFDIANGELIQQ